MAEQIKIGIIEDEYESIIERYGFLKNKKEEHEAHITLIMPSYRVRTSRKKLEDFGFDSSKIYDNVEQMPEMDFYFCDGLEGKCFDVADKFGKDKTFIHTDAPSLHELANNKGYNTIRKPREFVENLTAILDCSKQIEGFIARNR